MIIHIGGADPPEEGHELMNFPLVLETTWIRKKFNLHGGGGATSDPKLI